jgi:RNA polymerase sigma-70 factor (ECF subfamily)
MLMVPTDLVKEIERLHESAFGWARACCGGRSDEAEDVLQTTYLKILDGRAVFEGRSAFRTWLFGVVRRTAAEHRRRRFARTLGLDPRTEPEEGSAPTTPDAHVDAAERAGALRRAVGQLSRRQREVLHLVFYEDLTVEQAAEVVGVSVGSARAHYHRGKERLRTLLTDPGAS